MTSQQQASTSDSATERLEKAVDVLDEKLSTKIDAVKDALTTFQQALPDSYMPRRESMEIITGIRGQVGDLNTRVTAMEEWRLAETKAAGLANAAFEAKIAQAVMQAMKDNATTALQAVKDNNTTASAAASEITRNRTEIDGRTIALYGMVILLLLGWLFTIFHGQLTFHP